MRTPKIRTRPGVNVWAAMIAGALILAGCGGAEAPRPGSAQVLRGARVETVRWQPVADEIEAPGSVIARATADVSAQTMATITRVAVREGDRVQRGQLLVQLDSRELASRSNAAQAALEEATAGREEVARALAAAQFHADVAQKTYDRYVYLRDQKSVSPQEFDEVEAKFRAAQAGLAQAKAARERAEAAYTRAQAEARAAETVAGYAQVTSPFDGVVVRRTVDAGSMAAPGMALLVVEETGRYQMEVTVDSADAGGIKRGTAARVALDALPGKEFTGRVVEMEAGADPASHTIQVRIELPRDSAIRSGLFGRAWFRRGERRAIAIPRSAIVERGQLHGVYVVDAEQTARLRLVTLGRTLTELAGAPGVEFVEVLSGLSEGDRILATADRRELDGWKVEASR